MATATVTPEFASLREKIAWEKEQRLARYARFAEVFKAAQDAGREAAEAITPTPMIVGSPTHPLGDDIDPSKPVYRVDAGVCGFAWVLVRPATCSFARWLVKMGYGSTAYKGGVAVRIGAHGQSYERKVAHAAAMAETFNRLLPESEFGRMFITVGSRLD